MKVAASRVEYHAEGSIAQGPGGWVKCVAEAGSALTEQLLAGPALAKALEGEDQAPPCARLDQGLAAVLRPGQKAQPAQQALSVGEKRYPEIVYRELQGHIWLVALVIQNAASQLGRQLRRRPQGRHSKMRPARSQAPVFRLEPGHRDPEAVCPILRGTASSMSWRLIPTAPMWPENTFLMARVSLICQDTPEDCLLLRFKVGYRVAELSHLKIGALESTSATLQVSETIVKRPEVFLSLIHPVSSYSLLLLSIWAQPADILLNPEETYVVVCPGTRAREDAIAWSISQLSRIEEERLRSLETQLLGVL